MAMVDCVPVTNSLGYVQWVSYNKRNPRHWFKPRYWVWDGGGYAEYPIPRKAQGRV
jgi:hypothetical protein